MREKKMNKIELFSMKFIIIYCNRTIILFFINLALKIFKIRCKLYIDPDDIKFFNL